MKKKLFILTFLLFISISCCVKPGKEHRFKSFISFETKEKNDFWKYFRKQNICKKIEIFDSLMIPIIYYHDNKRIEENNNYAYLNSKELNKIHPNLILLNQVDSKDCIYNILGYQNDVFKRKVRLNKLRDIFHWMFVDILSDLDIYYINYLLFPYPEYSTGYPRSIYSIFFENEYLWNYNYDKLIIKIKEKGECY